jgi:hypothetical protein
MDFLGFIDDATFTAHTAKLAEIQRMLHGLHESLSATLPSSLSSPA